MIFPLLGIRNFYVWVFIVFPLWDLYWEMVISPDIKLMGNSQSKPQPFGESYSIINMCIIQRTQNKQIFQHFITNDEQVLS